MRFRDDALVVLAILGTSALGGLVIFGIGIFISGGTP